MHQSRVEASLKPRGLSPGIRKVSPMAAADDRGTTAQDLPGPVVGGDGLLHVVRARLAESGADGIPNISRATSRLRRITWILLFLAGLGMFVYLACSLILTYYSWPLNVNIEIRTVKKVEFPAVTWCNLNPIVAEALLGDRDLDMLIGPGSDSNSSAFDGYPEDWDDNNIDYSEDDSYYETVEKSTELVGSYPYSERHETGHQIKNMLLKCTFQQKPCSPGNFTRFYNSRYGNCYTFNSGVEGAKIHRVTKIGPSYGLSMEIYIQQDQYVSNIETGAGVRVIVHNQTDMPFPEDQGANVAPGSETFIGMYRVLINRLPKPYGDCSDDFQPGNLFRGKFPHLEYTQAACEKDCYFQEVLRRCNCADVRYRYDDLQPACNSTAGNVSICMETIEEEFTSGTLDCLRCHMSCNETNYILSYSSSTWPNHEYKDTVEQKLERYNKDIIDFMRNNSRFVEENVLRVNIFYDNLNYDDIYQSPAYTRETLASDLGGQVGLWIGVSVLTIFEFLELMYDVIVLVLAQYKAGGKGRKDRGVGDEMMTRR